jgi:cell division protein FtsX
MLETIAWVVFLMCLGAILVIGVAIAIVMISREDI